MAWQFQTVCTADHYQYFIPAYVYSINLAYPDTKIIVCVRGELNPEVREVVGQLKNITIIQNFGMDYPFNESGTNMLRYLIGDTSSANLITDIDFMFFPQRPGLDEWHETKMAEMRSCYAGHHGPYKKPRRFLEGWTGDRERIACGFLWLTSEWYAKTKAIRDGYLKTLQRGNIGVYREEDEVVFCQIIKKAGMPVPKSKEFPPSLFGIHLGDFKFDNRWQDLKKMQKFLTDDNCRKYLAFKDNSLWRKVEKVMRKNDTVKQGLDNLEKHIAMRGL